MTSTADRRLQRGTSNMSMTDRPESAGSVDAEAFERLVRSLRDELYDCYSVLQNLRPLVQLAEDEVVEGSAVDYAVDSYRSFVREAQKRGAM